MLRKPKRLVTAELVDDEADLGEGSTTLTIGDPRLRDVEGVSNFPRWRTLLKEREWEIVSQPRLAMLGSSHGTGGSAGQTAAGLEKRTEDSLWESLQALGQKPIAGTGPEIGKPCRKGLLMGSASQRAVKLRCLASH